MSQPFERNERDMIKKLSDDLNIERPFITEIQIEDLFGLYSYHLAVLADKDVDVSRLLILYGDNGSGKTTILNLIFNLLSSARRRGHRSYLASIPFRRFEIRLGEIGIIVDRSKGNLIGSYQITVIRQNTLIYEGLIEADSENSVPDETPALLSYLQVLNELGLDLFYLADDRNTQTSLLKRDVEAAWVVYQTAEGEIREVRQKVRSKEPPRSEQILEIAIDQLESWIRTQAIKGSSEGEANTNTIYTDIARRIARAEGAEHKYTDKDITNLLDLLNVLSQQSKSFAKYGLISKLQLTGLVDVLESASGGTRSILASILIPYVDGIRARLDALQDLQNLIELFIDGVNSFFHNKTVSFDITKGIQIFSSNSEELSPKMLSSGERQLLLLFCNTITARDQASIFIIDEPEISLNVKWQRSLLDTLLGFTKGSNIQFVVATHSVELLARHRAHVLRLTSEPKKVYA